MARYSKLIIAVMGAIIVAVQTFLGIDLAGQGVSAEAVMAVLVPLLTAFGVWANATAAKHRIIPTTHHAALMMLLPLPEVNWNSRSV